VTRRQTPAPAQPRRVENTRWGSWVPLAESGSGVFEAPDSVATTGFAGTKRHWLPGAWVLVFDNVGCISRPDASGIASRSRSTERSAAGESSSRRAEAPSTGVSRSETSERRAKLFTSRGQPGERNRATKEHFAGFRARLKALRIDVTRTLIGRFAAILGQAGQRRATLFTERLRHERTVALEPFGRARAVTGSVRDGRQTAKAPPAERRGGSAWRRARSQRVAAT
jgi:hypothetical protein